MLKPQNPINFDANASYGLLAGVREKIALEAHLNPSSIHSGGQKARAVIELARDEVRAALGLSHSDRVIFTSGATEANNTAVFALGWRATSGQNHLLTTAIEHPSILEPIRRLEACGEAVTYIKPNARGEFTQTDFVSALSDATKFVSIMAANNETGAILPVARLVSAIRVAAPKVLIHCDAVQALGKGSLAFKDLGVDMLSISAHKIGGLSGVGALIVSDKVECEPLLRGGPQETRWRAGTENVIGIASFGLALKVTQSQSEQRVEAMLNYRRAVEEYLCGSISDCRINCSEIERLPNTISVEFPGVRADDLVVALDLDGVLVSSGAACASGKPEPSHVLLAMGLSETQARATIRISLKAEYEPGEVEYACERIVARVKSLRDSRSKEAA